MADFPFVLTFVVAVSTAAVGGVLFAFSGFVMRALARVAPDRGIAVMQQINITVMHWLCGLLFFGTGLACVYLLVRAFMDVGAPEAGYLLAGGLLYVFGGLAVTGAFNVPLNNKLAKFDPSSAEGHAFWRKFVPVWLAANHVRTIACFAASACFVAALLEA